MTYEDTSSKSRPAKSTENMFISIHRTQWKFIYYSAS